MKPRARVALRAFARTPVTKERSTKNTSANDRARLCVIALAFAASALVGCLDDCNDGAHPAQGSDARAMGTSVDAHAIDHEWPTFPTTRDEVRAISRASHAHTNAASNGLGDAGAADVIARVTRALDQGHASVGWSAIDGALSRRVDRALAQHKNAWAVFGTHHDSAEQIRAFGMLTGALAHTRFGIVALEQLRATGHYRGASDAEQAGDDEALARWLGTGDLASLDLLAHAHVGADYAAWKYDYASDVIALAVAARAKGTTLTGCDLPASLRARLPPDLAAEDLSRFRENHCVLALDEILARDSEPHAIALLYGDEHASISGFSSMIGDSGEVFAIHMLGARASPTEPDEAIAKRIVALEPIFVDDGDDSILLLPEEPLSRHVDRSQIARDANDLGPAAIEISATHDTRVHLGARALIASSQTRVAPTISDHVVFAWERGGRMFVTELDTPDGALVEVHIEDAPPELRVVIHTAKQVSTKNP